MLYPCKRTKNDHKFIIKCVKKTSKCTIIMSVYNHITSIAYLLYEWTRWCYFYLRVHIYYISYIRSVAKSSDWALTNTNEFHYFRNRLRNISNLVLFLSLGKIFVPKQKPIDLRQEEVTTLDPELEEALSSATNTELCDIAGKSGKNPSGDLQV